MEANLIPLSSRKQQCKFFQTCQNMVQTEQWCWRSWGQQVTVSVHTCRALNPKHLQSWVFVPHRRPAKESGGARCGCTAKFQGVLVWWKQRSKSCMSCLLLKPSSLVMFWPGCLWCLGMCNTTLRDLRGWLENRLTKYQNWSKRVHMAVERYREMSKMVFERCPEGSWCEVLWNKSWGHQGSLPPWALSACRNAAGLHLFEKKV